MATAQEIRAAAIGAAAASMVAVEPAAVKPQARTFYHQIAGARFGVQRSPGFVEDFYFVGGQLETSDPQVIEELDKVADRSGSLISSDRARARELSQDQQAALSDARTAAEIAAQKMVAAGERTA